MRSWFRLVRLGVVLGIFLGLVVTVGLVLIGRYIGPTPYMVS